MFIILYLLFFPPCSSLQVTEAVQAACGDRIAFSNKASVQVKGKGQLTTMFVLAERN
jgi:hypothetical protein